MKLVPLRPPLKSGALLSDNLNARYQRLRGSLPTRRFTTRQIEHLRMIINTLAHDLHDPATVEILLVLLEVFYTLDVSDYYLRKLYGARCLHALRTWGDIVPPKRRPPQLTRAWVWVPNRYQPKIYPIAEDGTLRIYDPPPPAPPDPTAPPTAAADSPSAANSSSPHTPCGSTHQNRRRSLQPEKDNNQ
jgi:hypothetical protein